VKVRTPQRPQTVTGRVAHIRAGARVPFFASALTPQPRSSHKSGPSNNHREHHSGADANNYRSAVAVPDRRAPASDEVQCVRGLAVEIGRCGRRGVCGSGLLTGRDSCRQRWQRGQWQWGEASCLDRLLKASLTVDFLPHSSSLQMKYLPCVGGAERV
jgi:hypothetical protein